MYIQPDLLKSAYDLFIDKRLFFVCIVYMYILKYPLRHKYLHIYFRMYVHMPMHVNFLK